MRNLSRLWLSNSLVNLVGGLSTAVANVLLPAVVVHRLSAEEFSAWNMALQIVAYVNLLSFGLQTATARAVAHATGSLQESESICVILQAARSIAYAAAFLALLAVAILVALYPLAFPAIPPALLPDFRLALFAFGIAAVLQIPAQAEMGLFQGLHRNRIFVSAQSLIRGVSVFLVWLGSIMEKSFVTLALLMAVATSLLWPVMRAASRHLLSSRGQEKTRSVDRKIARELLIYCATLSVWSVSMLLVNSAGIVVVGRFDFQMVGPYAIAMTAVSVLVGLMTAALSPLMTGAASLHGQESTRPGLAPLLSQATLGVTVAMNIIVALSLGLHEPALKLWVGPDLAPAAGPLLLVLVAAHCLRNLAAPYSMLLIATGLHRRALVSAVLEGVANLTASVLLGMELGAIGVALGSLVGAIVGLLASLCMNLTRTPLLVPNPLSFASRSILLPMALFAPVHLILAQGFLS